MNKILKSLRGYGEFQKGLSFDAVVRHLLADETELLEKFAAKPEDCFSCDVIFAFEHKLVFIDLWSTNQTIAKNSYVRYNFHADALFGGDHFNVNTKQFPLETKHIEKMLQYLSAWLKDENNEIIRQNSSELIQITDRDICE